jgi:plasmid segregation protein ParM
MAKKLVKATKVGTDGGNGELKLMFENMTEGLAIPTAEIRVLNPNEKGNFLSQTKVTPENIQDHLDITYVSSKSLSNTNERYLIGKKTLTKLKDSVLETDTSEAKKYESEVVARTVLAGLLVHAIRQNPEKDRIEAAYDLSLCLPFIEVDQEQFQKNSNRFIGTHELLFHYPQGNTVTVVIKIEYAVTNPESAVASFGIVYERDWSLKQYPIKTDEGQTLITLENRPLLIPDIGAGTLDAAVMNGVNLDFDNSIGVELGTKKTIEKVIEAWNRQFADDKLTSLTQFNDVYGNEEDFNSSKLQSFTQPYLENDAKLIAKVIKELMSNLPSQTIIVFCGGGSLLFKPSLITLLDKYSKQMIFKKDAKFANAEGLLIFATHPTFEEMKKDFLGVTNG